MKNFKLFILSSIILVGGMAFAKENYQLKEVVILSRHNLRAPLASKDSVLGKITSHNWIKWPEAKNLTNRGGVLETIMGQYFKSWTESEGLFDPNTCPIKNEVNIYANTKQRTIATAKHFSAGFAPTCDIDTYYRFLPYKSDPIFFPKLTKLSPEFLKEATKQINNTKGFKNLKEFTKSLEPSFNEVEKIIGIKKSKACKDDKKMCDLNDYDTKVVLKLGDEPRMSGSLKLGNIVSDALMLQYYETPDNNKLPFGKKITKEQYKKISKLKDSYVEVLFTSPIVATNIANPLIVYIRDELNSKKRKFTYLVGHDSNLASVMSSLEIEEFELKDSIENRIPIGSKLMFEKWEDKTTKKMYVAINFMYQSTDQIRNLSILDLDNPPVIIPLKLKGLKTNKDGLYSFEDVIKKFDKTIMAYDNIK
ncbi:histidine-type phosphatase [Oceanivirga salmonicida]|uniref:histidine-type phosphatase n=1 Tax=Oceanivirga salmonicida TaxID=1769291 RepID=UPI00083199D2|nr:histidine-type phosphatase [Oceanivirga salmonicida]